MNELLWAKVPPPRVAAESKLMGALSLAVAIYAVPVVLTNPEPETIALDYGGEIFCCFCGHDPYEELDEFDQEEDPSSSEMMVIDTKLEPELSREQAIEQARVGGVGCVGALGSSRLLAPNPFHPQPFIVDDGELYQEDGYSPWRVRSSPQLAAEMQPPLHASHLSMRSILSEGALDRPTVRRYLKRQHLELERCHDVTPSLQLGRTLRGETDPAVQFLIDRDGRVVQVVPYSSTPELAECLERTIKTLRFPASDGATLVHVPLHYGTIDTSAAVFVR